jgi:hypothetical protein
MRRRQKPIDDDCPRAVLRCTRSFTTTYSRMQAGELLARELAAFLFWKGETQFDLPASGVENLSSGKRIAGVVAFAAKTMQRPGCGK